MHAYFISTLVCCTLSFDSIIAAPLLTSSASSTNGIENLGIPEDDFTTHGLERLSSAATCLVAKVEYTHGQQIYRLDPCEFCLCLDGEMFCWWQECAETSPTTRPLPTTTTSDSLPTTESEEDATNGTSSAPVVTCVVLGTEYRVGEKLPHDTGNCIECVCAAGAKVTCSPHQCVDGGEDVGYRPSGGGARLLLPDSFK